MRWPFVSAARIDAIVAGWTAVCERERQRGDAWKDMLESERAAHAETRKQMHELRMAGADPVLLPKADPKPVDPMVLLINQRTVGKPALRGVMLAQLRKDRAEQKTDVEIQRAIEAGEVLDGLPV